MARQQAVPTVAPTLQPERAIPILENLISQADSLVNEQSDSTKRQQWAHTGEGALLAALGNKHPNIQAFGAAQCGVYYPGYDTESYLRQQANEQLEGMAAVLSSTVDQLRWQLPDPTQVFLPAGSAHDAVC